MPLLGLQRHPYILYSPCVVWSKIFLPQLQSVRLELEMRCLVVFTSPAVVELAVFFCSASLIASSVVSGQERAKGVV